MTTESQNTQILAWLLKGKSLTQQQAVPKFCCWRLAARISELRDKDHDIKTFMMKRKSGRHHARYYMEVSVEENGQTRIN